MKKNNDYSKEVAAQLLSETHKKGISDRIRDHFDCEPMVAWHITSLIISAIKELDPVYLDSARYWIAVHGQTPPLEMIWIDAAFAYERFNRIAKISGACPRAG